MFATVSTAELDASTPMELRTKRINEELLPALKARPGFVTGYWFGPLDGRGMSVVLVLGVRELLRTLLPARRGQRCSRGSRCTRSTSAR